MSLVSVVQETATLQRFASRFAEDLEFYAQNAGNGQITGEQVAESAMDIIRIDLRRSDVMAVIKEFPIELCNLILHAYQNPKSSWAAHRQITMIKAVGGLQG